MNKKLIKYLIAVFACLAVLYPLWIVIRDSTWAFNSTLILNLFPLFGLIAFSLLWLHAISGVFEPWLRKQIDFDRFVSVTASLILICLIFHPLLLLLNTGFKFVPIFFYGKFYIWLAIIGWLLLITYDISKPLKKKYDFFIRNWNNILLISNIGFLLTFFHSLGAGGDLQSGPLKLIWIFYGTTAIIAIIYTYGIKGFSKLAHI